MTREQFLEGVGNWSNHRYLLWEALEATQGDVIEMGMGDGSTQFLHDYCKSNNRRLFSFDNVLSWVDKFRSLETRDHQVQWVSDWDVVVANYRNPSVVLVDHAPGERRKIDISRYFGLAQILVAHDTEIAADHGYQMRNELNKFKFKKEYISEGAGAMAVSNTIDVSQWKID